MLPFSFQQATLMIACYLGLRWQAYAAGLADMLRRRAAWLLLPALPYAYLLIHDGDPAVPWLPLLHRVAPTPMLLALYALAFALAALPALELIRPASTLRLFAPLPLSKRLHRAGDALLALSACAPLPLLLFVSALVSHLKGGMVDGAALAGIALLTFAATLIATAALWLGVQTKLARRQRCYQPPWPPLPAAFALPLNAALALAPPRERALLYAAPPALLAYLASVPGHYRMAAAMLAYTVLQLLTRLWLRRLEVAAQLIHQQLAHWPLPGLAIFRLAFAPYLVFHALFALALLTTQPVNPLPLFWLCLIAPLHCLLLRRLRGMPPEQAIYLQGFSWVLGLAFVSELIA